MTNTNIVTDGLDAERIASLVRESNPVCLLPWRNEGNAARNDCTLYVYQTHGMDGLKRRRSATMRKRLHSV